MSAAKTHLSLNVSNLEKSIEFYSAFFGVEPHKRRQGYANFDLSTPPLKLALMESNRFEKKAGPLNHLGIVVEDRETVEASRDRLKAAGLATFDEKDTTCCFALQDKVWVHDPDGNQWEVYVLLDDMQEVEHDENEQCCDDAACCSDSQAERESVCCS